MRLMTCQHALKKADITVCFYLNSVTLNFTIPWVIYNYYDTNTSLLVDTYLEIF